MYKQSCTYCTTQYSSERWSIKSSSSGVKIARTRRYCFQLMCVPINGLWGCDETMTIASCSINVRRRLGNAQAQTGPCAYNCVCVVDAVNINECIRNNIDGCSVSIQSPVILVDWRQSTLERWPTSATRTRWYSGLHWRVIVTRGWPTTDCWGRSRTHDGWTVG